MLYVLLGFFGFGFAAVAEWAAYRRIQRITPIAWVAAAVCGIVSVLMVSIEGDRIALPTFISYLGWVGVVIFGGLLVYSALIELYLYGKSGTERDYALVTTGTYALTRHPAFLWLALALICLVLATRSRLLLVGAPLWVLADGLYVWFEEKVFFERMFPGYREYQRVTPMLLPTPNSMRRFLRTWSPVAEFK